MALERYKKFGGVIILLDIEILVELKGLCIKQLVNKIRKMKNNKKNPKNLSLFFVRLFLQLRNKITLKTAFIPRVRKGVTKIINF